MSHHARTEAMWDTDPVEQLLPPPPQAGGTRTAEGWAVVTSRAWRQRAPAGWWSAAACHGGGLA